METTIFFILEGSGRHYFTEDLFLYELVAAAGYITEQHIFPDKLCQVTGRKSGT